MNSKQVSLGLGVFSIALGLVELLAPRRVAGVLDAEGHEGLVRGYGAREIVAGAGLLKSPALPSRVWNRVGGDIVDLGTLALAARRSPRNGAIWGAIAFVAGVTVIDAAVAWRLQRQAGKAGPAPV